VSRSRLPAILAALLLVAACGLVRRGPTPPAGPLDVNTASLADLEHLPGVTPSMAQRIYEGRPYGSLDELVERGLLSERELERVRSKLRVGGPSKGHQ
jgi:radical SAM superfamily enzyme with C-terminal helix-hairpin-helix motif